MTLALIGILLGECDIGSRVFGAYARTAPGAAKRIAFVVALSMALAAPISVLTVHPESALAQRWATGFGLLGTALFLHFLFPYRWGMRRGTGRGTAETCRQLTDRVMLRSVTIEMERLPQDMDELTVLAMSDLHCNSAAQLDLISESLDQLAGDELVLVLGDLGENASLLPKTIETLSHLTSRYGTFCVRGNHDFEGGRAATIEELVEPTAITLLSNEVFPLPGLDAAIVGLEHPWACHAIRGPPGFPYTTPTCIRLRQALAQSPSPSSASWTFGSSRPMSRPKNPKVKSMTSRGLSPARADTTASVAPALKSVALWNVQKGTDLHIFRIPLVTTTGGNQKSSSWLFLPPRGAGSRIDAYDASGEPPPSGWNTMYTMRGKIHSVSFHRPRQSRLSTPTLCAIAATPRDGCER